MNKSKTGKRFFPIITIAFCILSSCWKSSTIPSPEILWSKTYGGSGSDKAYAIEQTSDGGYVLVGETYSFGLGWSDVYIIKTDANGKLIWQKVYGGTYYDVGRAIQRTVDNCYIIAGSTNSFGLNPVYYDYDVYLMKIDPQGDTLWTKTYGGIYDDKGFAVQTTGDNGYLVVGCTYSFGAGENDIYLIKTDAAGDIIWTKTYGNSYNNIGYDIQKTSDGGYIIIGFSEPNGLDSDIYLLKIDGDGNMIWSKTFGGEYNEVGSSIKETPDKGYIFTGETWSFGKGTPYASNVDLLKVDQNGLGLWGDTYGGANNDAGYFVQSTSDQGYIIIGYTSSFGTEGDIYLMKLDENGDSLWTTHYEGNGNDIGFALIETLDGGYIIAGYTNSFGAGDYDVYLIKTTSETE